MCTPANTPATPPNFPDALTMFSRLKASESFNSSSSPSMATSPPPPPVSWGMTPPVPNQQGLWTQGPSPQQAHPPPGWPSAVNQQAATEQKASVAMEAERWGPGLHGFLPTLTRAMGGERGLGEGQGHSFYSHSLNMEGERATPRITKQHGHLQKRSESQHEGNKRNKETSAHCITKKESNWNFTEVFFL